MVFRRLSVALFASVCAAAVAIAGWVLLPTARDAPIRFRVAEGAVLGDAVRAVAEAYAVPRLPVRWLVTWRVPPQRLRAGTYEVAPHASLWAAVRALERGDILVAQFTIPEGWTVAQLRDALARSGTVIGDTQALDESALMKRLGANATHAEGWFMPDTYRYPWGASDLTVLKLAHQAMLRALDEAWRHRDPDLPIETPEQALTLASIVEKETGVPTDRAKVAAVFVNRLRLGMRLQTDPTVIYGLGDRYDGTLHKRDLLADTPYNTYTREGLPPTPIALPGRASIEAALHPAHIRALYFVARGDGTSEFSESLAEHNRAVDRYQKKS